MPVSEQEFIFIRLCVLREVLYQQYFCFLTYPSFGFHVVCYIITLDLTQSESFSSFYSLKELDPVI